MSTPWDDIGLRGPVPQGPKITGRKQDTFVTYRPLPACQFCSARLAKEMAEEGFPQPTTEVICPHTRKADLDALLEREVRGGIVDVKSTITTLPSGIVQITVLWTEIETNPVESARPRPNRL